MGYIWAMAGRPGAIRTYYSYYLLLDLLPTPATRTYCICCTEYRYITYKYAKHANAIKGYSRYVVPNTDISLSDYIIYCRTSSFFGDFPVPVVMHETGTNIDWDTSSTSTEQVRDWLLKHAVRQPRRQLSTRYFFYFIFEIDDWDNDPRLRLLTDY